LIACGETPRKTAWYLCHRIREAVKDADKFSRDAMLLVLASEEYDPASYIRDYEVYLRRAGEMRE